MVDFELAKKLALDALSKGNKVVKVSEVDKQLLPFLKLNIATNYEVFLIETEYLNNDGIAEEINLYMVLKPEFPLVLPKIYLPQKEYNRLKYIPHIDINCFICTFDNDTTRTNPDDPGGIVQTCLSRAINIIESGVSSRNHSHFEDEFQAYWEIQYDDETDVKSDILILIDDPKEIKELNFIKLNKTISTYNHVIYQKDEIGLRFIYYLNYRKISYVKESIHYIGLINLSFQPPFKLDNEKVNKMISLLDSKKQYEFRKYINSSGNFKFIFGYVQVKSKPFFIGWIHNKFELKRKGFRKATLNNYYAFRNLQKNDPVARVSPQIFTPKQAIIRTDGLLSKTMTQQKFLICGLGCIGSNLLYFLNTLNNPEIRLVDFDILNIDNLNRHFLGMDYLGILKTEALKKYYTLKNPFQKIKCKNESIIKTCQTDLPFVNDSDFIFCTTGIANIDQWIGNAIRDLIIIKPTFFLWVEPYLCAGHCLFLTPNGKSYDYYFDERNFYKNNIIDNDEYLKGNQHLSSREIGCQTSYIPYSLNNVTSFLSSIFYKIREIIDKPPKDSMSITWIGDLQILVDLKIETSTFAKDHLNERLIIAE